MDESLKKQDAAALQAAIAEGQGTATTDDDKYFLGFFTLQLGILNKDQALQEKGLDMALDSGKVQPANAATFNFFSGQFAYQKKDYAKAIQRLEAAKAAGSTESNLPAMLLESYVNGGQTDKGIAFAKAEIDRMMAAGQRSEEHTSELQSLMR